MVRFILIIVSSIYLFNCSNQTIYSGKVFNKEDFNNINFVNKVNLIEKMGFPSFIDPLDNKYFYYSEKETKKSIFNKSTEYSYVFVFKFDENDKIVESKVYDLKNTENIDLIKDETENEVVKRGLIEKIFGGVGPQQTLPNSP